MMLYIVSFIDRINVGFAALTMNRDIGLTPYLFGLGAGIFFFIYFCAIGANLGLSFFLPQIIKQQGYSTALFVRRKGRSDSLGKVAVAQVDES